MDLEYSLELQTVLEDQWDTEWVIGRFQHTLQRGNGAGGYDLMLVLLPSVRSHGHHTASGLLALVAIDRLQRANSTDVKIPTVLGGSEFVLYEPPTYPENQFAKISAVRTDLEFRFNLRWKTIDLPMVDYQTVLLWMAAEHKSQGTLVDELLNEYHRDYEQYFYFSINDRDDEETRLPIIQNLFTQLVELHQDDRKRSLLKPSE